MPFFEDQADAACGDFLCEARSRDGFEVEKLIHRASSAHGVISSEE
jgi:hypothetical protein